MTAKTNFVRQQGFAETSTETSTCQYSALMWQPRIIGVLVVIGLILQPWPYFLVLSALLWWNALLPALNPFDALYNQLVAKPRGLPRLDPAPAPRRFAQGMAGTFMLGIGLSLLFDFRPLFWTLAALLLIALSALIFGRFCLGSYLFFLFTGKSDFANRTLPWSG